MEGEQFVWRDVCLRKGERAGVRPREREREGEGLVGEREGERERGKRSSTHMSWSSTNNKNIMIYVCLWVRVDNA